MSQVTGASLIANLQLFRKLAVFSAAAAATVGALALFGWTQGAIWLTSVVPGFSQMKPNTSASVIALAIAIGIQWAWPRRSSATLVARGIALAAVALSLATLGEYLFGWHLRLDEILLLDQSGSGIPGRMGANTAVALAFLGIAIALEGSDRELVIVRAHILAIGAAVIALFTLVGYVYSAIYLYQIQASTPMAINTALALFALCGAVFWSKPDRGLMVAVHAADSAGLMLRRTIPAAVIVPIGLGWLALNGERAGLYESTFGAALLVLATITIFVTLVIVNARSVKAHDATRERAQAELQEAFFSVERRVVERTQELNEALSRLADSERRYDLATEGSNSGILDLDIPADKLHCSRRWNEMLGRRSDELLSTAQFIELVHADERESAMKALLAHFKGATPSFSIEVRMRHADGSYRWMLSRGRAVRDAEGNAIRMIGSQTDIGEIKALQEALRDASIRDGITGLYNRTHFAERLTGATHLAHRHRLPLSFCMFDIDKFKQINDTYGHQIGDAVIKAVGAAVTAEIRAEDLGARYGGDEFCIMFEGTNAIGAVQCLERIKSRVENTPFFANDGRRFSVTVSFGVSDLAEKSVPELIEAADRALYVAKSSGRSRIIVDKVMTATSA